MKKTALLIAIALIAMNVMAFAEPIDLSAFDDDALVQLYTQVQEEMQRRNVGDESEQIIMHRGARGEDIKVLQEYLIALGYLTGTADGNFGSKTVKAVIAYQKDKGLAQDGRVTQSLLDMIIEDVAELPTPVTRYSAEQLYNYFDENKLAAEEKLSNTEIEVSGKVDSVDTDIWTGEYYVKLAADSWGFSGVYCYFGDDTKSDIAKIKKGQTIVIRGVCSGANTIGDPQLLESRIIG